MVFFHYQVQFIPPIYICIYIYICLFVVVGFGDLGQDDQLILIKSAFFEVWLVRIARMFSPIDNTLTFGDGIYITREQLEMMISVRLIQEIFYSLAFVANINTYKLKAK